MKHDFRKEPINRKLRKLGFSSLGEKELIAQMGVCVRDHDHFRSLMINVEPAKRTIAYEALRAHLRFTPKPLEVYLSEAAQQAEAQKLPVWDEKNHTITDYSNYHGSGRPQIEVLAERAIKTAELQRKAKGNLILTCQKCTVQGIYPALDRIGAYAFAVKDGWVFEKGADDKEQAICPNCPAVRPELSNA